MLTHCAGPDRQRKALAVASNRLIVRLNRRNASSELRSIFGEHVLHEKSDPSRGWMSPDEAEQADARQTWVDQRAIQAAMLLINKARQIVPQDTCLYVVSDGRASKIGVSADPHRRLQALQTSSSAPLSVYALVWSSLPAVKVEQAALRRLANAGVSVLREWAFTSPSEALSAILAAARELGAKVAPAGVALGELIHRLRSEHALTGDDGVEAFIEGEFNRCAAKRILATGLLRA